VELVLPYGVEHRPRWARHQKGLGVSIRRSVAATIAAAVVATGALSGCGDDEGEPADSGLPAESELTESAPEISPDPSGPTPSNPTPPGPQEPPLPAAAKAPGKAGAKAFVAYYIRLLNYMSWTGDTEPIRRYSTKSCFGCRDDIRTYERGYARGGWEKGRARSVKRVFLIRPASPEDLFVGTLTARAKGTYRDSRNDKVMRAGPEQYLLNFFLDWASDGWKVARLERPA
jgi:Family of unknown function (DUF6318)